MQQDEVRVGDELLPFEDLLPSCHHVEEAVVAKLTFLDFMSILEPRERLCAVLLCMGYSPREVANEARYSLELVGRILHCARKKLRLYQKNSEGR